MIGKIADIAIWEDDDLFYKVRFPAAKVTCIARYSDPCLIIQAVGGLVTDAGTGDRVGTRPAEPEWCVRFTLICEVSNTRSA